MGRLYEFTLRQGRLGARDGEEIIAYGSSIIRNGSNLVEIVEWRARAASTSISLLVPYCMDEVFALLFRDMGFSVVHSEDRALLETAVRKTHIDIALEWQKGPDYYPIRELLRKYNKRVPILLFLNWNGTVPPNLRGLGYQDYLEVPPGINEMMTKFHRAVPESKKRIIEALWPEARNT